jgi:hypothetical protein
MVQQAARELAKLLRAGVCSRKTKFFHPYEKKNKTLEPIE